MEREVACRRHRATDRPATTARRPDLAPPRRLAARFFGAAAPAFTVKIHLPEPLTRPPPPPAHHTRRVTTGHPPSPAGSPPTRPGQSCRHHLERRRRVAALDPWHAATTTDSRMPAGAATPQPARHARRPAMEAAAPAGSGSVGLQKRGHPVAPTPGTASRLTPPPPRPRGRRPGMPAPASRHPRPQPRPAVASATTRRSRPWRRLAAGARRHRGADAGGSGGGGAPVGGF